MPDALVLDASLALAAVLPGEDRGEAAAPVLARLAGDVAVVPAHWHLEVGNGVLMAARRGRLSMEQVPDVLRQVAILPVRAMDDEAEAAWTTPLALALTNGLTLYDAAYLAAAQTLGLPLGTLDAALRRAARTAGVAVVP